MWTRDKQIKEKAMQCTYMGRVQARLDFWRTAREVATPRDQLKLVKHERTTKMPISEKRIRFAIAKIVSKHGSNSIKQEV